MRSRVSVGWISSAKYCFCLCFTHMDFCISRGELAVLTDGMRECVLLGCTGCSSDRKGNVPYDDVFV